MSRPLLPSDQATIPPPMPVQAESAAAPSNATPPPLPGAQAPTPPPPPPPPLAVAVPQDAPAYSASPLAEAFPQWDLMPPAEFIKRARR